jgi:hypothetical protein
MAQQATFIIVREDLQVDPVTIIGGGILIGRLPTSELLLNHPSVSRLHAGITSADGGYYIRNLRPGNPIMLNGERVEEYQALTSGDVLGIGPFALNIDLKDEALVLNVSLQIAATAGDAVARREVSGLWEIPTTMKLELPSAPPEGAEAGHKKPPARKPKPATASSKALDVFWDKRITAATKTVKPSPLFPRVGRATGKAQSVWTPTTDLKRRWPISMMVWSVLLVGLFAAAGALFYASAFSPDPIADAHLRAKMVSAPPIAVRANAGSCTSCHALTARVESKCASCHTTGAFVPTVIHQHVEAGIGCVDCHAEHRGVEFSALTGALLSCAGCHNDSNKQTYKGKMVATPHGGNFGYPVINGQWKWKGLDPDELSLRQASLKLERLPSDNDDQWRSKQFHTLHLYRVKAVAGLPADKDGNLSCSSCHTSFNPIDVATPRTTCAKCHMGQSDPRAGRQVIASDKPNCTSCHVQHIKDQRHWNPGLFSTGD